ACTGDDSEDDAEAAAAAIETLTQAWSQADAEAFGAATDKPKAAAAAFSEMTDELLARAEVSPAGEPECTDDGCAQTLSVAATLDGLGEWRYDTEVSAVRDGDEWRVHWEPSVLHPELTEDTA